MTDNGKGFAIVATVAVLTLLFVVATGWRDMAARRETTDKPYIDPAFKKRAGKDWKEQIDALVAYVAKIKKCKELDGIWVKHQPLRYVITCDGHRVYNIRSVGVGSLLVYDGSGEVEGMPPGVIR